MNKKYLELFDKTKFDELNNFFLNKIGPLGKIKKFLKNDFFCFNAGEELFLVQNGEVNVNLEDISGKEQLIYRIKIGGILGEVEMLSDLNQSYTVYFPKNTQLSFVSKVNIKKLLKENPDYYLYFIKSIARAHNLALLHWVHNRFYSSEERIIEFLLRISSIDEPNRINNLIIEDYTHENIASNTNTSRYLVTKVLKKLSNMGIIQVSLKRILILNFEELKKYRKKISES